MRLAVLISGGGSNLQALLDSAEDYEVVTVISNQADAFGLERARKAGVPALIIEHTDHPPREAFEERLHEALQACRAEFVALAGFMRVLGHRFVAHYQHRMLNIHPSLLPAFPGLHTHQRALDAGVREHGASVHFVTGELDGGPLIMQGRVAVHDDDSADTLAARVLGVEHQIYPLVAKWFARGRLRCDDQGAWLDGELLREPRRLEQMKCID